MWLQEQQYVGIDSSRHSVVLSTQDEENAVGMKPSDLLLIAVAACTAVDVVKILAKKRMPVAALTVEVRGEQDPEPPWAFRAIHLAYRLRGSGLVPDAVEQAIRLADEKYCSVAATIRGVAAITWESVIESE
jgi:putative redox protein